MEGAVLDTLGLRGRSWTGQVVEFLCDNTGAVAVVNSGYSRVTLIMHLLRCLFSLEPGFKSRLNCMADAISNQQSSLSFFSAPDSRTRPADAGLDLTGLGRAVQELFSAGLAASRCKSGCHFRCRRQGSCSLSHGST